MNLRLSAAVLAGKAAGQISRRAGAGGGTTLPGAVASRLAPSAIAAISGSLPKGCIVVTGTNGKTTTTRLISSMLSASGLSVVHNRAGANLLSGIGSALVRDSRVSGHPRSQAGLFEVDEAVMPEAAARLRPRVLLITNLFRDQLDRYGEVDYLAGLWREAVEKLPNTTNLILNADDPFVAGLGMHAKCKVSYFGIDDRSIGDSELEHAADARNCRRCGAALVYDYSLYGHIGHYSCSACDWRRPEADVSARSVELEGLEGSSMTVATAGAEMPLRTRLPGVYNVGNVLAATAVGLAFGLSAASITLAVETFTAAFGRVERIPVGDRSVFLALVKNPVGFNQVLSTVFGDSSADSDARNALIYINDLFADGTDISWLWDVDFERLAGRSGWIITSGTRGEDMRVRLKYAGIDTQTVAVIADTEAALRSGLERTLPGGTLFVLPTYTAMIEVRSLLSKWGHVEPFWEN